MFHNVNYELDSNLNSVSTDFGITGRRGNRKTQSIRPQYTRLLTERSVLTLSYSYSDIDYLEAENTNFRPYVSQTGSASLQYDLTEKDTLSISLQGVDYESRDKLESTVYYSISRDWNVNAAYSYIVRRFKSDTSEDRAPHSNRLHVGLSYNFPSLSTY